MDIIGEVTSIKNSRNNFIALVKQSNASYYVQGVRIGDLKKGETVAITNAEKKNEFLKTIYNLTDKSTISLSPGIYFTSSDISLASLCIYAPLMTKFMGVRKKEGNKELNFYKGIRGKVISDDFSKIAKRYPKELKGKFSYKSMYFSKKFGVLFFHILHFGKFPVVFSGDEIKGILLSTDRGGNKYVVIKPENGTMEEKEVNRKELNEIIELRNKIIRFSNTSSLNDYFGKISHKECNSSCPVYSLCQRIGNNKEKWKQFTKFFIRFAKEDTKNRKLFLKTVLNGQNPLRGTLPTAFLEKKSTDTKITYDMHIVQNEASVYPKEKVLMMENPPLSRKAFATVKNVDFSTLTLESDEDILKPGGVTPINEALPVYRGIYDYLYSNGSIYKYFNTQESVIAPFQSTMYIQNDAKQNEAINRMLNFTGLFCLIGERGTGKKFVLREFSVNIAKRGKTILIACENKKEETEMFFKKNLSALIKEEGIIQICSIDEVDLYLKEPEFDYAIVLIDSELKKTTLLSIAGKAKNVIFATTGYIPFEDRIPKANRIKLATEHRFGEHILHFVQPILSDTIKPTTDREIILKNKEAVTAGFMQIVNPEKFVQFVFVRGKNKNLGNKWNDEEATFILLAVKEFIKSGIERKNIGIIVSYERQKAYIEQLLKNSKISEIQVMLPEKSIEHDIIFVSFTDVHKIGGAFTDSTKLKIALTRAKSKLILVGNKKIIKTSKLLSRIL